eukprot:7816606-Pyramimonas_sp.AAC.1
MAQYLLQRWCLKKVVIPGFPKSVGPKLPKVGEISLQGRRSGLRRRHTRHPGGRTATVALQNSGTRSD